MDKQKPLMEDESFKADLNWFQFQSYVKGEVSMLIKPFHEELKKRHVEA